MPIIENSIDPYREARRLLDEGKKLDEIDPNLRPLALDIVIMRIKSQCEAGGIPWSELVASMKAGAFKELVAQPVVALDRARRLRG